MNFVFRADASVSIGSGHVMRCLSLADALGQRGARCHFVSRDEAGPLLEVIARRGHGVLRIPNGLSEGADLAHCLEAIRDLSADWVVVDHYSLGEQWEVGVKGSRPLRLMALDDLGRRHCCDLLLDQNFSSPMHAQYRGFATAEQLLLGPAFALLRPEFAAARQRSLQRRDGSLQRLLVTLGGSDPGNETAKVLAGVASSWREGWIVDVVIGAVNPHRDAVEAWCARLPDARLHVQTQRMAELMTAADCAITAGGSTTWERCCLGLPGLVTVVSDDQGPIAQAVAQAGAHVLLGRAAELTPGHYATALAELNSESLLAVSRAAARLCDGAGAGRVAARLHTGVVT